MHPIARTAAQKLSLTTRLFAAPALAATLALGLAGSLTLLAPQAYAQSATTGAIGGVLTDSGGAVLPNANVTVTTADSGVTRTVKTNATGEYRIPELEPGSYTATFTADGFAVYAENSILVTVGSISNVSPSLKVGAATSRVEVADTEPLLNTQDSSIATTIDQNAIDNLPINGRRWSNFALLTPGVVSNSDGFGLLSFRGISVLLNNSTVDGADNNQAYFSEERGRTRASYSVSQAAVQEFQVNLSNYSAEYGRAAGGVINTVTKSGTNQYHGELFYYDRDNAYGATNPYTLLTTQVPNSTAFQTYVYKPKDWRKQWGFGVGGPVLPSLRNKLFWFYSYDQSRRNFPGTARASDPAATFAQADSVLPAGSSCVGGVFTAGTSTPLPGTPYACSESNALNTSYTAGASYYQQGLGIISSFLGTVPRHSDQVLNFPRLDWQINDNNRFIIQYNRLRYSAPAGVETQASNFYGRASFGNDFVKEDFGIVRLSSVLNPNLVNSFLFQFGRDFEYESSQTPTPNELPISTTIPDDPLAPSAPPDIQLGYEFDGTGFDVGRVYFMERRALPNERRLQGEDIVTWSHGKHVLKAGVEVNRVFDYIDNLYQEGGSYSYDYQWDFIADYLHATTGVGGTGYKPQFYSFSQGFGNPRLSLATTDYAGFITDDWRVTPNFTLTAGLRYEYEYIPLNPFINTGGAVGTGGGPVPQTANQPNDRNNLGPRLGFNWNVFGSGHTTVRGGYGMYYGRIINSNIIQTYLLSGGTGSQVALVANGSNTCASAFPAIYASASDYQKACGNYSGTIAYLDKHLQNPQIHEVDLSVQQNLGWNTVLSVSYMGSFGRQLAAAIDQNVAPATATTTFQVLNNVAPNPPGYVTFPNGGLPLPLVNQSLHTYKRYTTASGNYPGYFHVLDFKSEVNSSYHALVVQVNHHISHNLSFLTNYTYAHAMDYNPYLSTGYGSATEVLDPFNLYGEYATSELNVRHRAVAALTYRTNFADLAGWRRQTFNGWGLSPIVQVQTGQPYSAEITGSNSGTLYGGILGVGGAARVPDIGRDTFTKPNSAVVDLRLSKSFAKEIGSHNYRFEILGEAFNLLNHQNITAVNESAYCMTSTPSLSIPATGLGCPQVQSLPAATGSASTMYLVGNPLFGTYQNSNSNTLLTPRQLQIAGRLYF